jgi:hypothetical protein|tara:strand:- start:8024 stop:8311 length:288 start_codon:yes stop_codon:yes gene_type:complete
MLSRKSRGFHGILCSKNSNTPYYIKGVCCRHAVCDLLFASRPTDSNSQILVGHLLELDYLEWKSSSAYQKSLENIFTINPARGLQFNGGIFLTLK